MLKCRVPRVSETPGCGYDPSPYKGQPEARQGALETDPLCKIVPNTLV